MLTPSIQDNVTELNDTRRWRSYSTLEHIFTLDDFGKLLTCKVYHPAYENSPQETSVSLDLLCKNIFKCFSYKSFLKKLVLTLLNKKESVCILQDPFVPMN